MLLAYYLGRDAALQKFAARRSVKEIRKLWGEDLPTAPDPLAKKNIFDPYPESTFEDQHEASSEALAKRRQAAMAAAERMDHLSKGTAFKRSPAGTQINPVRAGEYGGGMEGIATPVLQGSSLETPGGVQLRKHYFDLATREGLARPELRQAKREMLLKLPPSQRKFYASHYSSASDVKGTPVDFWENVPGWAGRTMAQKSLAKDFGRMLEGRTPEGVVVTDLHEENVLHTPQGMKAVDWTVAKLPGRAAFPWPWTGRADLERARARQERENPPLLMARRFDSPAAAKQKMERGGYAEDPKARIDRLKLQRKNVQAKAQTPAARENMRKLQLRLSAHRAEFPGQPIPASVLQRPPSGSFSAFNFPEKMKGLLDKLRRPAAVPSPAAPAVAPEVPLPGPKHHRAMWEPLSLRLPLKQRFQALFHR